MPARRRAAEFGDRTLDLVRATLGADWAVFFLIDDRNEAHGFRSLGAPAELPTSYVVQGIEAHDPLHPRQLIARRQRFLTLHDPCVAENSVRFRRFLSSFDVSDAAEMIFWNGSRTVGGLSLIWRNRGPLARPEVALNVQSYIEFNLPHACAPEPDAALDLTEREWQVAELAARGYQNPQIADALNISLATVKTHLLHIFGKLHVTNRVELSQCIFSNDKRRTHPPSAGGE